MPVPFFSCLFPAPCTVRFRYRCPLLLKMKPEGRSFALGEFVFSLVFGTQLWVFLPLLGFEGGGPLLGLAFYPGFLCRFHSPLLFHLLVVQKGAVHHRQGRSAAFGFRGNEKREEKKKIKNMGPRFHLERLRSLWFLPIQMPRNRERVHFSRRWLRASGLGILFPFGFSYFRSVGRRRSFTVE